jgi:beta-glucanase (GH16 family)
MHLRLLTFFVLASFNLRLSAQIVPEPPIGKRWVVNQSYTDDFNGDRLDLEKWYDYHPRWVGRSPAIFLPGQVSVRDGLLQIRNSKLATDTTVTFGGGNSSTYSIGGGAVVSRKTTAHYGYYEARLRASDISMSTTFWMSNPLTTGSCPNFSTELDIVETIGGAVAFPGFATRMKSNTHYFIRDCDGQRSDVERKGETAIGGNSAEDFHTYGVWWKNGREMDFYLDGEKTHTILRPADAPLEREMHLNMVTETYDWEQVPSDADLADDSRNTSYYDFVHAFTLLDIDEEVSEPTPAKELIQNGGFETGDLSGWIGWGGNPREVVADKQAAGNHAVRIRGAGAPEQVVSVRPNAEYVLSAMVKAVSGRVILGIKPTTTDEALTSIVVVDTAYTRYELPFNSGTYSELKVYLFAPSEADEAYADEFSLLSTVEPDSNVTALSEYALFEESVAFANLPLLTSDRQQIIPRVFVQTNTDRNVTITLYGPDDALIAQAKHPALAGYAQREVSLDLPDTPRSGQTYRLTCRLVAATATDSTTVIAESSLRLRVNGETTPVTTQQPRQQLRIYPTLTRSYLFVELPSPSALTYRYRIFDLNGRLVRKGTFSGKEGRIELNRLPPGLYTIQIADYQAAKFTKQ